LFEISDIFTSAVIADFKKHLGCTPKTVNFDEKH